MIDIPRYVRKRYAGTLEGILNNVSGRILENMSASLSKDLSRYMIVQDVEELGGGRSDQNTVKVPFHGSGSASFLRTLI